MKNSDRRYEYNGADIIDKVSADAYRLIFAVGNHFYNNYDDLKHYVNAIVKSDINSIPYMLNSLTDIELRPLERQNPLANLGHNKRVFDYVSLVCAIKDSGYNLAGLRNNKDIPIYWANLNKLADTMIIKRNNGLDTNIGNPVDFQYISNNSFKRDVKFNSYIEGYDLCNLMNYLIQPNRDSSIFKSGSYVKKKVK